MTDDEMACVFCGSSEEVELIAVDFPSNIEPVCIACYEAVRDASLEAMREGVE